MPEVIPLRSFYYKEGKDPENLKELVAPPYDVISKEEEEELKNHPNNIAHVILPRNKYEAAGKKLKKMIETQVIIHNKKRCIVIYGIEFISPDNGKKFYRYGFVALLKLVEIFPANDGILPHEQTFPKYTIDRYNLIQQTDANFSPIFMIYNDQDKQAEKIFNKYIEDEPLLQTIDRDNFFHKIWEITEENDIREIQNIVKKHQMIIADGHHRYITGLRQSRHGGCNYIMALFIDFNDPGLIIYTTHREIKKLPVSSIEEFKEKVKDYFKVEILNQFRTLQDLMNFNRGNHVFGVYFLKKYLFLRLKESIRPEDVISGIHSDAWKTLNIPILHELLLEKSLQVENEHIDFVKDVQKGIKKVDEGIIDALFLLNPTTLPEIQTITRLKEIMPQKSTYFYPKPLSGLVIHQHSNEFE
jgi:uncharacterized protein (DUF1015 family)